MLGEVFNTACEYATAGLVAANMAITPAPDVAPNPHIVPAVNLAGQSLAGISGLQPEPDSALNANYSMAQAGVSFTQEMPWTAQAQLDTLENNNLSPSPSYA